MNTFTKFDQLGACLAELSFRHVGLTMTRNSEGAIWFYCVSIQDGGNLVAQGIGDTPTDALAKAFAAVGEKQATAVEAKAAEIAA